MSGLALWSDGKYWEYDWVDWVSSGSVLWYWSNWMHRVLYCQNQLVHPSIYLAKKIHCHIVYFTLLVSMQTFCDLCMCDLFSIAIHIAGIYTHFLIFHCCIHPGINSTYFNRILSNIRCSVQNYHLPVGRNFPIRPATFSTSGLVGLEVKKVVGPISWLMS